MKRTKRTIALVLACLMMLAAVPAFAEEEVHFSRLEGSDRYQTAMEAAKNFFVNSEFAMIASGASFEDALFAGPFAAQYRAPLLLTEKNALPKGTIETLRDLHVSIVYLIGTEDLVSSTVEESLKEAGFAVVRIGDAELSRRAESMSSKAAVLRGVQIIGDATSLVVSGDQFADALTAGPLVHALRNAGNSSVAARYLPYSPLLKDLSNWVVGGENSVPAMNEEKRIEGTDRYETAVAVAEAIRDARGKTPERIVLVDGTNYPDALSAVPVAAETNGVILLTQPDRLNEATAQFIRESGIRKITILGGENSVSNAVEEQVRALLP